MARRVTKLPPRLASVAPMLFTSSWTQQASCLLWTLALLASSSLAKSPHFCKNESLGHLEGCLQFVDFTDSDLHLLFTGHFDGEVGWQAFGQGTLMSNSLMFVFYPAANASGLVVSTRTTTEHKPPKVDSARMSQLTILRNEKGWREDEQLYVTEFICKGCASVTSAPQIWVWAANKGEKIDDGAIDAPLHMHHDFSLFSVDFLGGGDGTGGVEPPLQRVSAGTTELVNDKHAGGGTHNHKHSPLIVWHGLLMASAFLVVYPAGALLIRFSGAGFRNHWISQSAATALAATAACLAIYIVLQNHSIFRIFVKLHHFVGTVVVLGTLLQAYLGYRHHTIFVRTSKQSRFTSWHVWLGRIILILGIGNTAYGANLAGNVAGPLPVSFAAAVVATLWLTAYVWLAQRKSSAQGSGDGDMTAYELVPHDRDDDN